VGRARREGATIAGVTTAPGARTDFSIPLARLLTGTRLDLPVCVVHGARPGPSLWLTAAIHGDEINGVEIIRQVLGIVDPVRLAGTLIAVPIVNVFGFIEQQRYLPDRRDLNRSFPGSVRGSLAARLAHVLMHEIVRRCEYGIDLHTGSRHRTNLPQVRGDLDDERTRQFALAFGAPTVIHSRLRDGSLREAATRVGVHVLLYEAGEALRFDQQATRTGVRGVLRALCFLRMWKKGRLRAMPEPFEASGSRWIRARRSGMLHLEVALGAGVVPDQRIGFLTDALGGRLTVVRSPFEGLVIGHTTNPLAHRGDALVHIAME